MMSVRSLKQRIDEQSSRMIELQKENDALKIRCNDSDNLLKQRTDEYEALRRTVSEYEQRMATQQGTIALLTSKHGETQQQEPPQCSDKTLQTVHYDKENSPVTNNTTSSGGSDHNDLVVQLKRQLETLKQYYTKKVADLNGKNSTLNRQVAELTKALQIPRSIVPVKNSSKAPAPLPLHSSTSTSATRSNTSSIRTEDLLKQYQDRLTDRKRTELMKMLNQKD